jgi:hypothetical protein
MKIEFKLGNGLITFEKIECNLIRITINEIYAIITDDELKKAITELNI